MSEKKKPSTLKVQEGIEQPSQFNPEAVRRFRARKHKLLGVGEYVDGIRRGDRSVLGQAITLVESVLPMHQQRAQEVIEACLTYAVRSIRIGITGVPGVGKSTFIEALGTYLTRSGHKLAVLAIDPSSQLSRGSILGDKTRMENLSIDDHAFIRPSPSAGTLGGVARKTRESIILCEAAGFDTIFVETVGVGQSETSVYSMVDFFLLLMLAGAGDELQGIKRGIMEMADAVVINKADGDNVKKARLAKAEFENALHLFPPGLSGWAPKVETCSAIDNTGIANIWKIIQDYRSFTTANGYFLRRRQEQNLQIFTGAIRENFLIAFHQHPEVTRQMADLEHQIVEGKMNPYLAAQQLMEGFIRANTGKA
ncbi:MAG: methylmalonyl Co-A mutase-associated GTPase MeaB [Bacteroidetes bacterium]|nr:methylmalonyl Co-A mutase-associated GTPase MeaB [Bacteroidota bacterium]